MAVPQPVLSPSDRLAVLDVGSNSLRLLLCEGIGDDGPVGERDTTVVGLRRGAADDGTLAPEALGRLERALAPYAARVRAFAPARTVAVCTSAVRDAPNRQRVIDILSGVAARDVHVLAGEQEAALAFAGAALAVPGDVPMVVIDIGGGSTELVTGSGGRRAAAVSLDLGAVRHTERYVHTDPPEPDELSAVRRDAMGAAAAHVAGLGALGPDAVAVAVAGTATTLAAIDLGAYDPRRVHGHRMLRDRIDDLVALLASVPLARRREIPGLEPARAGVITAGAVILATVLDAIGSPEVMVSERDILDGVAMAASGRIPSYRL